MTLLTQEFVANDTTANDTTAFLRPAVRTAPRGGSYVTTSRQGAPEARTEGTYITTPRRDPNNGERVRGRYVSLGHAARDQAEGTYTRRA